MYMYTIELYVTFVNYKSMIYTMNTSVNLKAGRRLLLLECQSSILILGFFNFFGLVLFFCIFLFSCLISPSEHIQYCVTIKYLIMRIMCSSAYI